MLRGWFCTPLRTLYLVSFRHRVFTPYDSHICKTPWSVFQDGSVEVILTKSLVSSSGHCAVCAAKLFMAETRNGELAVYSWTETSFCLLNSDIIARVAPLTAQGRVRYHTRRRKPFCARKVSPNNIPPTTSFSTISSLLTLFSKFFSSFLRSTCSLSVSHKYLALEEVYLPFRAAIPNNPTLRNRSYSQASPTTGLSPSLTSCSKELMRGAHAFWTTL